MKILIESNFVMFNRRTHVPKYTVSNIISNSLIINELHCKLKMCFVNWRILKFRSVYVSWANFHTLHFIPLCFKKFNVPFEIRFKGFAS